MSVGKLLVAWDKVMIIRKGDAMHSDSLSSVIEAYVNFFARGVNACYFCLDVIFRQPMSLWRHQCLGHQCLIVAKIYMLISQFFDF